MLPIIDMFIHKDLYLQNPGYNQLNFSQIEGIVEMPEVIEQIQMRVISQKENNISLALNHWLNFTIVEELR